MSPTTAIALSGGVDSLAAALLLREAGGACFAVHFRTGIAPAGREARLDALRDLARRLEMPLHVVDLGRAFRRTVVAPFAAEYRRGRTPNPCVRCNRWIKFGALLAHARRLGAERLATGHYARQATGPEGRPRLLRGVDAAKDQSYFLARLRPAQLARAVFPLGEWTKARAAARVARAGLTPVRSAESQDVCFVPASGYAAFIAAETNLRPAPGPVVDLDGRRIGTHPGLHRFTVGQRRGIDCPGPEPYYVVRLDAAANRLVVGPRSALRADGCRVSGLRWIAPPPAGPRPVSVRLRYRSPAHPARLTPAADGRAAVRFEAPAEAVTPGQCAVFYDGDEVLGSGWIEGAD